MKKNCRTCRHARWRTDVGGRRQFGYAARCMCPFDIDKMPKSVLDHIYKDRIKFVWVHTTEDSSDIKCATWEPIPDGEKNTIAFHSSQQKGTKT